MPLFFDMLWLILSILSATAIYVIFKFVDQYKTPLINVIVINYIVAATLGFIINGSFPINDIVQSEWIFPALIIGFFFIVLFFVVGVSSQKAGISITTVASKMSVVIPMVFAIIAYNENVNVLKIFAIALAVLAVAMSVYVKPEKDRKSGFIAMLLPLALFIGMGVNNSLLIFSKENYVNSQVSSIFTSTCFGISLIFGVLIVLFRPASLKGFAKGRTWFFGLTLGAVNFGAVYFIFLAMNSGLLANSVTYGVVDVGIVLVTVLIGTLFFREKLSKLNISGIILSVITIILLTIADM